MQFVTNSLRSTMVKKKYIIEAEKPFSDSLIWQLNRKFYDGKGIDAWRQDRVPHHLTSNSMVGKTYAELILAFLKDLAAKRQILEKVYIVELGAGHGRLAFHILTHLQGLIAQEGQKLPPYCYVLTDVVENNLHFFQSHPQFQSYFKQGLLDLAYFDALQSDKVCLRHSGINILPDSLHQPLLVIANYFFDSIPNDLFYFKERKIFACSLALETDKDPVGMDEETLLQEVNLIYHTSPVETPFYEDEILNDILEDYRELVSDTYLFFPHRGLQCLHKLGRLSKQGFMVLSMDKGFHEIHDLENLKEPEMIIHGSISFWVNYHAFGAYCKKHGGTALFPLYSTFYLELACLLFLNDSESYTETPAAYQRFVDDFGPDDFNGLKRFTYKHMVNMSLLDLIGMLRLSAYDSTFFINLLPRLKQVSHQITFNQRKRLAQTMHQTWNRYFTLNEPYDLAFEIGGMLYQLGFYQDALSYFQYSIDLYGHTADVFYNRALCYYQLREDVLFLRTVKEAKASFPAYERFGHLDRLDLAAI